MATRAEIARENGKKGGRPVGSTTKFKMDNFVSEAEFAEIMKKAKEMAKNGNEGMIKWIGDHKLGKAVQPTDMNIVGDMFITFDESFKKRK